MPPSKPTLEEAVGLLLRIQYRLPRDPMYEVRAFLARYDAAPETTPAAVPSRQLTCEDVGCPQCCPEYATPETPAPRAVERTWQEERADVVAAMKLVEAGLLKLAREVPGTLGEASFAMQAQTWRDAWRGFERGDHTRTPGESGEGDAG